MGCEMMARRWMKNRWQERDTRAPDFYLGLFFQRSVMKKFVHFSFLSLAVFSAIAGIAMMSGPSRGAPSSAPGAAIASAAQPADYWSMVANTDPADLKIYREQNATLGPPKTGENRVVFIGDSITEGWQRT